MKQEVKEARKRIKLQFQEKRKQRIIKNELFNKMLDKCNDWHGAYLDDGESSKCAFNSVHIKVKEEFGDKAYEEFCDWLDEDNPGPMG